jgi:hypothetical protein
MIWLRAFVLGLFTRHLGTKLLALLLSVGLFSFVQFSQTGTREVPELELIVTLDVELRDRYVLLTPRLRLEDLEISGLRRQVNDLGRRHLQAPLPVEINERFLRLHREGLDIPVNSDFFRDEALWGKDIKVSGLPRNLKIELDELESRKNVIVSVAAETNRVLPDTHRYQGTLEGDALDISVNKSQVTLHGPKRVFGEIPKIILRLPDLARVLGGLETTKEQAELEVVDFSVDWAAGDIDPDYVEHLLISGPEPGAQLRTARNFRTALNVFCTVVVRKVEKKVSIPIETRVGEGDLNIDDWVSSGRLILKAAVRTRRAEAFGLRMPKSLADDEEFLGRLVLILNVAGAQKESDAELRVPVYLDLKGDRRPQDLERLQRIEIDAEQRWEVFAPK